MDPVPLVAAPASHQDQVVVAPPGATLIASSLFTPYAGFAWRDQPVRRAVSRIDQPSRARNLMNSTSTILKHYLPPAPVPGVP